MNQSSRHPECVNQPEAVPGLQRSGFSRAILVALVQQAVLLVLAALMLDGGLLLRAFAGALAASWIVSLAVMLMNRRQPTSLAIAIVKYGFWLAIFLAVAVMVGYPGLARA
jgi:hypothetical protein